MHDVRRYLTHFSVVFVDKECTKSLRGDKSEVAHYFPGLDKTKLNYFGIKNCAI